MLSSTPAVTDHDQERGGLPDGLRNRPRALTTPKPQPLSFHPQRRGPGMWWPRVK